MNRLFGICLACMFLAGCEVTDCPNGQCPRENQASADYPVPFCRIGSLQPNGDHWSCSATLVDRNEMAGLVVTAHHCTSGENYKVRFCNGVEHTGKLLAVDTQHDLAAVMISRPRVQPVECGAFLGTGTYRAYGFGGNGQLACVSGAVVEQYGTPGAMTHSFMGISGAPIPGDSGSGTVDGRGKFVGVLWGRVPGKSIGLITMGEPVTHFLTQLVLKGKWRPSESFTPGGRSIDASTRTIRNVTTGEPVRAELCGLFGRNSCPSCDETCNPSKIIDGLCPNCPRKPGGDEGGRRPIEDPIEVAPKVVVQAGLVGFRGDAAVVILAIGAALVVLFLRYFRQYDT